MTTAVNLARTRGVIVLTLMASLGTGMASLTTAGRGQTRCLVLRDNSGTNTIALAVERLADGAGGRTDKRQLFHLRAVLSRRPADLDFLASTVRLLDGQRETMVFPRREDALLIHASGALESVPIHTRQEFLQAVFRLAGASTDLVVLPPELFEEFRLELGRRNPATEAFWAK